MPYAITLITTGKSGGGSGPRRLEEGEDDRHVERAQPQQRRIRHQVFGPHGHGAGGAARLAAAPQAPRGKGVSRMRARR